MKEYYNANGIPPGEPTMKGSNADPYVADVALPNVELGNYSVPTDWPTNVKFNEPGDVPGPVVQFEDDDQGDVKAGYGFESDNLYEGDWFFFHTDHLGSTSYLTDTAGNVSQFVCYTPYGEAIVDEHLTTYENPFKFSGKELDDITGLYDHGARSRNPISTLWYGIDPLFEKYTDFSPYNYCAGNPVKLVDEDGRKIKVLKEYQKLFIESLKAVFGEQASNFSFNEEGILEFKGKTGKMNEAQYEVFRGLKKVMRQKTITNIVYESSYDIPLSNGSKGHVQTSSAGGALSVLSSEQPFLDENYVVVDPNIPKEISVNIVNDAYYKKDYSCERIKPSSFITNFKDATFHELGHILSEGKRPYHAIDYGNQARKAMGLPKREYDETHNPLIQKGHNYEGQEFSEYKY